ncbi:DUF6470 family protein [Pseudalkalibacillus sp. SCS-8]|uniref:DUF6470 family protein n=1 Tax=Pseudalkalibacillus nanhaiensis TaxID=3115291 RepID=UPI0032DA73A3
MKLSIPKIQIQSTKGLIGLRTTSATQEIRQPKAVQSIQQPKAEINIETTSGKLTIDQTQAWNDMDLKSVFVRTDEAAQLGKEALLDGISRRAQEGEDLMRIENQNDPIPEHARINSSEEMKEWNIGWIPSAESVKIDYIPAKVEVDIKQNEPIIKTEISKPVHNYQPGKVEVYMKQQSSIQIDFIK